MFSGVQFNPVEYNPDTTSQTIADQIISQVMVEKTATYIRKRLTQFGSAFITMTVCLTPKFPVIIVSQCTYPQSLYQQFWSQVGKVVGDFFGMYVDVTPDYNTSVSVNFYLPLLPSYSSPLFRDIIDCSHDGDQSVGNVVGECIHWLSNPEVFIEVSEQLSTCGQIFITDICQHTCIGLEEMELVAIQLARRIGIHVRVVCGKLWLDLPYNIS